MTRRHTMPKTRRLRKRAEFSQVFDERVRETRGPITLYARPTDRPAPRFGISLSKKVGIAVKRNRIKRLLREAFRLLQHDFPRSYDIIAVVRPHDTLRLAEYQKLLSALMVKLHRAWSAEKST